MSVAAEQAKSIFLHAIEIAAGAERGVYLNAACGADADLRREVEELLGHHGGLGSFLEAPALAGTVGYVPGGDREAAEGPGTLIGPYKLLEQIGEGGMGTVYLAEHGRVGAARVALKIIKAGMDSAQVLARFEAERQALALMDHPNIARVLDAGTVGQAFQPDSARPGQAGKPDLQAGRPYFVMELIRGIPITRYCDERHLPLRERLKLFIGVCSAVQHAHTKGIIHRDIKPSNVLVALYDGQPVVKVIDFGIAKATGPKLTERTLVTEFGAVVGTLEYMSPEQAELNNHDIDTRSDVYSLGVLLYELLTGTTPLDGKRLKQAALMEVLRLIREEEPPRPSTRLSSTEDAPAIAANRRLEPKKLSGLVRGELDWIVMKALEKDRNRRYETANGFAQDIQRYLANEPVQAGPASARYRLGKFVRRHRGPLLATGMVVAVLLVGVAVSTWQAVRAMRSEAAAHRSAETTRAINRYLIEDLFDAATPEEARGRRITVEEVLDQAALKIDTAFPDQPEVEAGVRLAIGQTYVRLSLYAKAEPHLRRALDLRLRHLGAEHAESLEAIKHVGLLCAYQGKYDEAEQHHRQALEGLRRIHGSEHRTTLQQMLNLAWVLAERHQHDRAEPIFRNCFETQCRVLGEEDPDTLDTMDKLAQVLIHQRHWRDAGPLARRCLEIKVRVLGENNPSTLDARRTLALVVNAEGKSPEAERLYHKNLTVARRLFSPRHRETLLYQSELGWLYLLLGRFSDAERELGECRDGFSQTLGADHDATLACAGRHALALLAVGKGAAAEHQAREILKVSRRVKGARGSGTLAALARLGKVLFGRGRWTEAEQCLHQAEEGFRQLKGSDKAETLRVVKHEHAAALLALGRRDEARTRLWQVLDDRRRLLPPNHPDLAGSLYSCGEYLLEVGQAGQAKPLLEEALRIHRKALPAQHPAIGQSLVALGWAHTAAGGDAVEGERLLREGLAIVRKALPENHWFHGNAESLLGDCLTKRQRFDQAESLLLSGHKKLQAVPDTPPARRSQALKRLVHFYDLAGQKEKATAWRKFEAEKKP